MKRMEIKGFLRGGSWLEEIVSGDDDGIKVTRVTEKWSMTGGFEGEGEACYVLGYGCDGEVTFLGFDRLTGTAGGMTGTLVLAMSGSFEQGVARGSWVVKPTMCSGDFAQLSGGEGLYAASGHDPAPFELVLTRRGDRDS